MRPSSNKAFDESIRFLYGLQGFGVKLGLTNVSRLMKELDDPQNAIPAIHIAGSNGKGSTAAFLASILAEAGYKTALYTSPHLMEYRERMRVQGRMIPRTYIAAWVKKHKGTISRRRITFFEATTAMAFDWFRSRNVEVAVIETGLGGRLDATNILNPLITVITSISFDHTHVLGKTLRAIAREKAGISKPGVPCVVGHMDVKTRSFLLSELRKRHVPVVTGKGIQVRKDQSSNGATRLQIRSPHHRLGGLVSGLAGHHQLRNIRSVMDVIHTLETSYGFRLLNSHIRDGLRKVESNTGLTGRCSRIRGYRNLYVDVAHNPEAMKTTAACFQAKTKKPSIKVIFGISADKDAKAVLRALKPIAKEITVVRAQSTRSLDERRILQLCEDLAIPAREGGMVREGLRLNLASQGSSTLLITGSHFVAGEALASLRRRKYLTITQ